MALNTYSLNFALDVDMTYLLVRGNGPCRGPGDTYYENAQTTDNDASGNKGAMTGVGKLGASRSFVRFNVAQSQDARVYKVLARALSA
jgi:hypothetical protein